MASDCISKDKSKAGSSSASSDHDTPENIMERWFALIAEYEAFRDALRDCVRQPHWPGVGPYVTMLKTEADVAARLLGCKPRFNQDDSKSASVDAAAAAVAAPAAPSGNEVAAGAVRLAASNLTAKEAMWSIIKKCHGVLALDRRFPASLTEGKKKKYRGTERGSGSRTDGVFVNAVVDDGREWLRVLTTTEQQLIFELTENGWEFGEEGDEEDDEGEDEDGDGESDLDDIAEISIVRTALDLVQAAHANRFKGAYPRLTILLTRIDDGPGGKANRMHSEVNRFLRRVRRSLADYTAENFEPDVDRHGVTVTILCANSPFHTAPVPPLDAALQQLMPQMSDSLTPTLNIDTSILIALTSDITHSSVAVQPWHPQQRIDEVERESQQPGQVLRTLCEAMRGRRLVCTREAAKAFREMVRDMGQQTELARSNLLARNSSSSTDAEREELVRQFRSLSSYPTIIPDDLRLPIAVLEEDWNVARIDTAVTAGDLPAAARRVAQEMTAAVPTFAVFFYGWASGNTTITTNLAAKNRIARLLERFRTSSDERGPGVWVCRTARSLNGTNPKD